MASYYVWSGATGSANGTTWANAYTTLTLAFSGKAAGDIFYVAHDHLEATSAAITLTTAGTVANPSKVTCVNRAGSVPPVSADRLATAQVTTSSTGTWHMSFAGFTHYDGIIFIACNGGSGAAHIVLPTSGTGTSLRFDNCSLRLGSSSAAARIHLGNAGTISGIYNEFNNTTASFGNASQSFEISGMLRWCNTPSALLGTIPTNLFTVTTGRGGVVECIGVDFSAATSGKTIVSAPSTATGVSYRFLDCKLDAAVTRSSVPGSRGAAEMDFVRSSATGNISVYRHHIAGLLTEETTIVRTGGASDGTTTIAWKIVTTANCTYSIPFECPPIAIWNDTTGSAKTATVEGIGSTVPNDDEVWLEVEYLGDAASPLATIVSEGKANLLATAVAQTTSSVTWGGALTGKFKLAVTFTAAQAGWIYARVRVGKASATYYLDPKVVLT